MKRTHSRWLLAVILASTSLTLQANQIAGEGIGTPDVTITVLGNVMTRPCTVSTSKEESTVELGDIYTYELASPGSASSSNKEVILNLTECPNETSTVKASFSGTPSAENGNYYKNDGEAENIEIELYNDAGTLSPGSTMLVNVNKENNTARFPLKVRARSENGSATQGSIQATINVTYIYE